AAQGKIDCDGGTLVGTTMTQDSMGAGPNGPTTSTFEQGAPGRPGDGYVHVAAVAVTCAGVLGIPGACPGGLPNSADDCNKPGMVDYSKGFMFDLALTTGTVTATVQHPRRPARRGPSVQLIDHLHLDLIAVAEHGEPRLARPFDRDEGDVPEQVVREAVGERRLEAEDAARVEDGDDARLEPPVQVVGLHRELWPLLAL